MRKSREMGELAREIGEMAVTKAVVTVGFLPLHICGDLDSTW